MRQRQSIKATVYDRKGHVLAASFNSYSKTHPAMKNLSERVGRGSVAIYLHAEVAAIIKALKVGTPHKIMIERYGKDGSPMLAKPCAMCEIAIREAGIHFVEYTC